MKSVYAVEGIPHAVLIEPGGYVVWEGFPLAQGHELTPEIVGKYVAAHKAAQN